jgi:ABC-type nitrate/sulfonate/bicarbonate transport system substrate-binding protein
MDNVLTVLLKTAKLDPVKSVNRLAVERGAAQIAALRQARVDGVIITQPDSTIAANLVGGHILIDLEASTIPPLNGVQYGVYFTSEQWLSKPENQQAAGCFVLALQAATDLARNDFPKARDLLLQANAGNYSTFSRETLESSIRQSALEAGGPAISPAAVERSYALSGRPTDKHDAPARYYTTKILDRFLAKR